MPDEYAYVSSLDIVEKINLLGHDNPVWAIVHAGAGGTEGNMGVH